MPAANWYSSPDRDMPSFGSFDPSMIADDDTRFILERIREELAQFGRGCEKPLYGLRAHCWMPDIGRVKFGYYMAEYNEVVLSAPESGKRVVVLPDAVLRPGGSVEVIDRMGNAGTTNITIKTIKAQTINRANTYTVNTNNAGVIFRSDGENWWAIASSPGSSTGSGDVVGPASATDNAIPRFNTTTGKLLQGSDTTLDDDENMLGLTSLTMTERADDAPISAGQGQFWVESTDPCKPKFTDDDDVKHDIIVGTVGTTDNRIPRSNGTSGAIVQASGITCDDSNNLSDIGTVASGAHTITQATDETVGRTLSMAVGSDALVVSDATYYESGNGALTLLSFTPIAAGDYEIDVVTIGEVTTAAGDGTPALGDRFHNRRIGNFKVVAGTVTQLGANTVIYSKSDASLATALVNISSPMAATTIQVTVQSVDTEVLRWTAHVKITRLST